MIRSLPTNPMRWEETEPFPHLVVDGLWDTATLREAASEFPDPSDPRWVTYPDPKEYGKRAGGPNCWGPATRQIIAHARSPQVCAVLEEATGITPLTADTIGGGMHMTTEGGRLASHVDFNIHPDNPSRERRLNLLVFLNPGWQAEWGGVLYLGKNRDIAVVPEFNRTVLFATSDRSYHGHPDPIVGDHLRKSIAVYYYTPVREDAGPAHSTIWRDDSAGDAKAGDPDA